MTKWYKGLEMKPPRTFTVAAVAIFVLSISAYSGAQTVKCTTWNLQWFPNGSAREASAAQQEHRIKEAADVLRPIAPDIILLRRCAITTCARGSVKPSHRGFITSQSALRSR